MKTTALIATDKVSLIKSVNNFNTLLSRFLSFLDVKESSKQTYRRSLIEFFKFLLKHKITSPEREDLLKYKRLMLEKELSAATSNAYLTACRLFFEWTEVMGLYPNISKGIKSLKTSREFRKDSLTAEQAAHLLKRIKRISGYKGKRDFAMINLMLATGLRSIEVVRLKVQDIRQLNNRSVLYFQGKARDDKEYKILTSDVLQPIRKYLKLRSGIKPDSALFISISNRNNGQAMTTHSLSRLIKRYLRAIGINTPTVSCHSLRHTAITAAAELVESQQATVYDVQEFARHKDLNTSIRYIHRIKRFKNAIEDRLADHRAVSMAANV